MQLRDTKSLLTCPACKGSFSMVLRKQLSKYKKLKCRTCGSKIKVRYDLPYKHIIIPLYYLLPPFFFIALSVIFDWNIPDLHWLLEILITFVYFAAVIFGGIVLVDKLERPVASLRDE